MEPATMVLIVITIQVVVLYGIIRFAVQHALRSHVKSHNKAQ